MEDVKKGVRVIRMPRKSVGISVDPKILRKVEALAGKLRISRSQMISNLLEVGLMDAGLFEGVGLVALVGWFRKRKDMRDMVHRGEGSILLEGD